MFRRQRIGRRARGDSKSSSNLSPNSSGESMVSAVSDTGIESRNTESYRNARALSEPGTSEDAFVYPSEAATSQAEADPRFSSYLNPRNYSQMRARNDCPSITTDGQLNSLPVGRIKRYRRKVHDFGLLVLGTPCAGKSRFIQMLFDETQSEYDTFNDLSENDSHVSHDEVSYKITRRIYEENGVKVNFQIIDVHGFDDGKLNYGADNVPILDFVECQNLKYMFQECQPDRRNLKDTRINACIYFFGAHEQSTIESHLPVLKRLSEKVVIIPVIGRSDSLGLNEREEAKQSIRSTLQKAGIPFFHPHETVQPPYLLVGCQKIISKNGTPQWLRPQGNDSTSNDNPEHTDFAALCQAVFRDHMASIIETSRLLYEAQRKQLLLLRYRFALEELSGISEPKTKIPNWKEALPQLPIVLESSLTVLISEEPLPSEDSLDSPGISSAISKIDYEYLREKLMSADPRIIVGMHEVTQNVKLISESWKKDFAEKKLRLLERKSENQYEIANLERAIALLEKETEISEAKKA